MVYYYRCVLIFLLKYSIFLESQRFLDKTKNTLVGIDEKDVCRTFFLMVWDCVWLVFPK